VISTTITPGVTGTLAQIAASAAVLQPNQSFGNAIVNVAQVFATSKVPAADYSAISIALTGTFAGTYGTNRGDSVAPVVAAQFLSSLGSGSTLLTPFLKAMEQTNYVNAADILGTYLDLVDSGILGTGSTETAGEKALVTAVEAYINNSTVLSELVNLGGPFNSGMTPTQQTAELLSLLQAGVTAANSDLYINEGSLTGDETPVVPM